MKQTDGSIDIYRCIWVDIYIYIYISYHASPLSHTSSGVLLRSHIDIFIYIHM